MPDPGLLILMRHAAAANGGGYRDHDRPLTNQGTRDATAAGGWIRRTLPAVDAVLCSTAARTRETLLATGVQAPVEFLDELYGGDIEAIVDAIADAPAAARTLLVIGHAPGIPAAAYDLATTARLARADADSYPTDPDRDPDDEPPSPVLQRLRHFSACALAVLTPDAPWTQIGERGAELTDVRHPSD